MNKVVSKKKMLNMLFEEFRYCGDSTSCSDFGASFDVWSVVRKPCA